MVSLNFCGKLTRGGTLLLVCLACFYAISWHYKDRSFGLTLRHLHAIMKLSLLHGVYPSGDRPKCGNIVNG